MASVWLTGARPVSSWTRQRAPSLFFALLATNASLTANWFISALGLVYSLLIIGRVSAEEPMLLESFGGDYRRYVRHTGRFFLCLIH